MPELLNIELILDRTQALSRPAIKVQDLLPRSVGWSGEIRDGHCLNITTGEERHLEYREWLLKDVGALPEEVIISFGVTPSVAHWNTEKLLVGNWCNRLHIGISVDLDSAQKLPLQQLEQWFAEQFKFLIPTGAIALLAGPELSLKWDAPLKEFLASGGHRSSNVWWVITLIEHSTLFSPEFDVLPSSLPGHKFLRRPAVLRMFE